MEKISDIFFSFMEIFPLPPSVTDQNLEVEYATFRDFLPTPLLSMHYLLYLKVSVSSRIWGN